MKNLPIVINFHGAPGSGKSILMAATFAELKLRGYRTEMSTEYAKELVWKGG